LEEKEYLGSYETLGGKKLTYYSRIDSLRQEVILQQIGSEDRNAFVSPSVVIRALLEKIDYQETCIWEEAMGDDI